MSSTIANGSRISRLDLYSSFEQDLLGLCQKASYDKDLLDEIRRIYGYINREEANLMFAGFMKAGKSTSVNTLLGRDLLPTKFAIPETGALCFIRNGSTDSASVVYRNGDNKGIQCTKEAIREVSTLQLANGQRHVAVNEVDQINLTLDGIPIPKGVVWIDSPGIGDDDQVEENAVMMTKRTQEGLVYADMLIWIWNTKNPLSMFERDFVAAYLESHGPLSLVSLLNCHLSTYNQSWTDFIVDDLPSLEERMSSFSQQTGLLDPVLEVYSASDRSEKGVAFIEKVRNRILEFADRFHPRIQCTRFYRAYTDLQKLGGIYLWYYNQSQQKITNETAEYRQLLVDEETKLQKANTQSFKTRLKAKIQEYRLTVIKQGVDADVLSYWTNHPITDENLTRDDAYSRQMASLFREFENKIAYELAGVIINDLNHLNFDATTSSRIMISDAIAAKLKSPYDSITVSDIPVNNTATVVGGLIGTFFGFGFATLGGAAAGRTYAEAQKQKKDVEATRQSITNAIQWTIGYYQDKMNDLVGFIETNYLKDKPSTVDEQLTKLFKNDFDEVAYLKEMGDRLISLANRAKTNSESVR